MTPIQADYLKNCNGFGRDPGGEWMPYIKHADGYYTPNGLLAVAPKEWRPATHAEIVAEMDANNSVPVILDAPERVD